METVIRWVWPGIGRVNPDTVQRYAQLAREGLDQLDPVPDLRWRNGMLRLDVERDEVDYWWLQDAVRRGEELVQAGEYEQAGELLERAVRLWTSRPFADLLGHPAEHRRSIADADLWAPAYDVLLRALDGLGRSQDVLRRLDDLPFDHHRHYRLAVHRIKALYVVGRQRDAMGYVQAVRRALLDNDEIDAADELLRQHDLLRGSTLPTSPIVVRHNGSRPPERVAPDLLPQDVDFVGQAEPLERLHSLTTPRTGEPARGVVIVAGPAGIGKTALVVHWGHRVRDRFPGGVLVANLSGYSDRTIVDPAQVVDDFIIACGHRPDGSPQERTFLLSRLLGERDTLVILDNVRDNDHVRDLLPRLAGALVVITSRRRLTSLGTTVGARRITVRAMTPSDADELLITQLGPHRELDAADRAGLVERCSGLPVAISVATAFAATCPDGPIAEVADQLTRRRLVVDLGDQDGTVNVGALFAQSYDSLDEPERRLFRVIGLHPGPDISIEAAAAGDGRTMLDTNRSLAKLIEAHLVEQPVVGRYRLHDLLAEFAVYCAETDEPADRHATVERMLRFYLAAVTDAACLAYSTYLRPPGSAEIDQHPVAFVDNVHAREWFLRERNNLLAAIVFSASDVDLRRYTYRLGDPVATFCDRFGAHEDSLRIRDLTVRVTTLTGDHEDLTSSLLGSAMTKLTLGEVVDARRTLEEALRLAIEHDVPRGRSAALIHLGKLEMVRGDTAAAMNWWRQGMALVEENNDDEGRCWYHYRIATVLAANDQHDEAFVRLDEARRIALRIREQSAHAAILIEFGILHTVRGDHALAASHLARARGVAEGIPDQRETARACLALAELDIAQGRTANARGTIRVALDICEQTRDQVVEAPALVALGTVCHADGEIEDAISAWKRAADLYLRMGNITRAAAVHDRVRHLPTGDVAIPVSRPAGSQVTVDE
ncbi:ATP-binding protein [Actinophytocola xinjiangensis]|uniref:ATP-binding protein n=1 Tax=Actinophytocola xinjiangensis TaxID=485602 RepID=UPI000A72E7B4|nr:BTAD domain-containing putative transcriptional regulator [Actinophytocola xinjiangensis]